MDHSVPPKAEHYDVIILGAGASGLLCAFTAAQRGRRVLVLERANKVGKKILMSGGGRCNFTNNLVEPDNFISQNPHFCKSALKRYTQWDFIELVERHGIDYEERKHSQLFCKDSAKDIVAMLLAECEWAGADIRTHCEVESIATQTGSASRYRIQMQQNGQPCTLECSSLVVATGALSVPTLGGSGIGYDIARQFGLPLIERQAGLVPFMFSDAMKPFCERLSGLALEIEVSCGGRAFTENMLFTHRGISGPAILQISNYWGPGDEVAIDLLPGVDAANWLLQTKQQLPKSRLKTVLTQRLAKALVSELQVLWWADQEDTALAEFTDRKLSVIGEQLNRWLLKPSATEGYRTAEVTLGGVATDSISSKTMEAKTQPGLYFIGEVLDVTGHLGGFNFQWAWSSGFTAGLVV
ncbi:MAG TPA: NAD(P)/FAD-dependent oxidoreductase [Pseudomonas xinjiangensis]|uniref:NAD(P)/FAD-dependent oxidoreductase n=2 Tax=root TaxID=1 RepID=A0A7V1BKR1_9GAMM|nr:NAD(P)/FAD-dependent oxidoreductase [Halopseudomonas xinjiangensis]HEC48309.1 NAD(P)/FAD-dependent oxidoreductase [Halopseudomonas xinjiangensis]